MEIGAHVWLRSETSRWGWVPAMITKKVDGQVGKVPVINLTLSNDPMFESADGYSTNSNRWGSSSYHQQQSFETIVTVDPEQLKAADHDDIKLRNLPKSYLLNGEQSPTKSLLHSPTAASASELENSIIGGVDDLIGLTHLHEPAILHALRLRYDADIIYTSTGPILIAVNPFKDMPLYSNEVMHQYRVQGEKGTNAASLSGVQTPFKRRTNDALIKKMNKSKTHRLPPHAYQSADDAYRAMMRGMENNVLMNGEKMPTNQSILVSGESGAGKTVTTKIVLNYFAMLSKVASKTLGEHAPDMNEICIEQQVLQSNPVLESFGNARTIRNDNSSRFGKYIDIKFSSSGKLIGANIETYLLEKVRLIHPGEKERNYHVFYQFLSGASKDEKSQFFLDDMAAEDFNLLSQTGEYKRRDGVSDRENHVGMKKAMVSLDFVTFVVCEYALCFMNANLIDKPLFIFLGIYWFLGWNNSILDASCGCCFMGWKHEIQRIGA
jgi:myosin-5